MAALPAVLAVASVGLSAAQLLRKPPKAPAAPVVPTLPTEQSIDMATEATITRGKKALTPGALAGRASTLLTGGGIAGATSAAPTQRKTLLGQ